MSDTVLVFLALQEGNSSPKQWTLSNYTWILFACLNYYLKAIIRWYHLFRPRVSKGLQSLAPTSSKLPAWRFPVILEHLISCFTYVKLRLELNSAGQWPSRNWVWHRTLQGVWSLIFWLSQERTLAAQRTEDASNFVFTWGITGKLVLVPMDILLRMDSSATGTRVTCCTPRGLFWGVFIYQTRITSTRQ